MNATRRQFLGHSAALAVGWSMRVHGQEAKAPPAANDRIGVAFVGLGGMGRGNLKDFALMPEVDVVALCDVDPAQSAAARGDLEKAGKTTSKIDVVGDFRRIVERKDVDAVVVSTPDHWHAYVLLAACANGKDVYTEKPLAHNIVEGRAMVTAAKKAGRVVQVGTQQRSAPHFQNAVRYVQSGKLGAISMCRTWATNFWPPDKLGTPPDDSPPPGVDYNMWLGPAPQRPFNQNRFHRHFRWFWDYGNGLVNDWGVHLNDVVLWAMNETAPLSVSAVGGKQWLTGNTETPDTLDVYFEYPTFTHVCTVRQGKNLVGFGKRLHGMEFQGSNGTLTLDREGWETSPSDRTSSGAAVPVEKHPGADSHYDHVRNFLDCMVKRAQQPASSIEAMHRATNLSHLANISYKVKRRIFWNADEELCYRGYDSLAKKFIDIDAEANSFLFREPRRPWSLGS